MTVTLMEEVTCHKHKGLMNKKMEGVTAITCTNIFRSQYAECVHFLIKSDEYFCLKALPKQVSILLEILT
jgi:hypothetical protein